MHKHRKVDERTTHTNALSAERAYKEEMIESIDRTKLSKGRYAESKPLQKS